MRITVQSFNGCPNRALLECRLAEAVGDRADVTITHQTVETPEEAARLGFRGSPTILVDNIDPFADAHIPVGLACRVFRTLGGLSGAPTVAQLREAIGTASRASR